MQSAVATPSRTKPESRSSIAYETFTVPPVPTGVDSVQLGGRARAPSARGRCPASRPSSRCPELIGHEDQNQRLASATELRDPTGARRRARPARRSAKEHVRPGRQRAHHPARRRSGDPSDTGGHADFLAGEPARLASIRHRWAREGGIAPERLLGCGRFRSPSARRQRRGSTAAPGRPAARRSPECQARRARVTRPMPATGRRHCRVGGCEPTPTG